MLILRRILLPVDFSRQCEGAGRYAKALAAKFQSELILLHVMARPHIYDYGGPELSSTHLPDLAAETRNAANRQLGRFLTEELRSLPVERIVLEGDAAQGIVAYSHSERIDLIIMPTHGYGPFRRFLMGSVTAKVLHDADCPVWTGVHLEEAPMPESISFERILCAVDLGAHTERVLSWASEIAGASHAQLVVTHVTAPVTIAVTGAAEAEPDVVSTRQARIDIEDLLAKIDVQADIAVDSGDVAETVDDFAGRLPADLLVIGRGAVKGVVGRLRSHAYSIIRQSPCPVVSV